MTHHHKFHNPENQKLAQYLTAHTLCINKNSNLIAVHKNLMKNITIFFFFFEKQNITKLNARKNQVE